MTFGGGFGRVFRPAFDPGLTALPWYRAGGAPLPVAAYQPKGASSLAASYVNLANPGTYDAAPGVAPTLDANGWAFDGTQYLDTGYAPSHPASMIVRFSNATSDGDVLIGSSTSVQWEWFALVVRYYSERFYAYHPTYITITDLQTSGVVAITPERGYLNGAPEGAAINETALGVQRTIYIASVNETQTGSERRMAVSIQAVAIYNATLTALQVAAVSAAMALI